MMSDARKLRKRREKRAEAAAAGDDLAYEFVSRIRRAALAVVRTARPFKGDLFTLGLAEVRALRQLLKQAKDFRPTRGTRAGEAWAASKLLVQRLDGSPFTGWFIKAADLAAAQGRLEVAA
jgi:hypothetical protein